MCRWTHRSRQSMPASGGSQHRLALALRRGSNNSGPLPEQRWALRKTYRIHPGSPAGCRFRTDYPAGTRVQRCSHWASSGSAAGALKPGWDRGWSLSALSRNRGCQRPDNQQDTLAPLAIAPVTDSRRCTFFRQSMRRNWARCPSVNTEARPTDAHRRCRRWAPTFRLQLWIPFRLPSLHRARRDCRRFLAESRPPR